MPVAVRRLAVSVAFADGETSQFTFRPVEGRLREERVVRGLHPMISRRLRFWRLSNFEVSRLPSVDDTYLFHCVAPEGLRDERFVALAEVRDLTEIRDASGALTALPEVEHILAGCLEGIRRSQAERPERRRLQANHVFLYIWPTVEVPIAELIAAARRLAPMTEGLGLEEVLLCFGAADTARPARCARWPFASRYQPGAGVDGGTHRGADRATVADRRLRPARPGGPAARHRLPLRARPAPRGRRAATSSSTIWTRTGGSCRSTDRQGRTGRASWSGSSARRPRSTRRASCASPSSATRPARSGRCPSPSAAASSRPSTSPTRWACRWSGSPSRPGRRSRARAAPRTWTGSPGCCAA